jgi:hypothetical protein
MYSSFRSLLRTESRRTPPIAPRHLRDRQRVTPSQGWLSGKGAWLGILSLLLGAANGSMFAAAAETAGAAWFVPVTRESEVRRGNQCEIAADRRIFAVMSFINAFGFDEEAQNTPMTAARKQVRELIAHNLSDHPAEVTRWRDMYRAHACSSADYIEWAITLNDEYPFRRVGPDSVCFRPETPVKLRDFPAELNAFWELAKMEEVWAAVKPLYMEELARYDVARMNADLDAIWRIVRMPRRETRVMVSIPNLLDRHYNACSIPCGHWFVSIDGPGSQNYGLNIHEYLHEIVNPLAQVGLGKNQEHLMAYFARWQSHPKTNGYTTPVAYVQECLVRALDARVVAQLYPDRAAAKKDELAQSVASGFELARVFYDGLEAFESSGEPFDRFSEHLLADVAAP